MRNCCYHAEKVSYCIECGRFPCTIYRKKLLDPHVGEPEFRYRHEIPGIFGKMKEMGPEEYIAWQRRRSTCPYCGGTVRFYHYRCDRCGRPAGGVSVNKLKTYEGRVPACGCFCGGCPVYTRERKPCPGAARTDRCERCKTFHLCCKEKGIVHCHQCPEYPCKKFKAFAKRWLKYGQNFLDNQEQLQSVGEEEFLRSWNAKVT
ncbi:MAG: hypothetical protein A4E28_00834 [Methanocella sp. PtaU1.Bin125]|nr:MAG: hypothetical protein A4E28_00834 [Methanocella sp. PtaU1.Bin125]